MINADDRVRLKRCHECVGTVKSIVSNTQCYVKLDAITIHSNLFDMVDLELIPKPPPSLKRGMMVSFNSKLVAINSDDEKFQESESFPITAVYALGECIWRRG